MKFALNGALTIGTWDGANIEMAEAMGAEQMFVFGLRADAVTKIKSLGYDPKLYVEENRQLGDVLEAIGSGVFCRDEPARYKPMVQALLQHDPYLLMADFADYVRTQAQVDDLFTTPQHWAERALRNIAGMGYFSTDRTICEYVDKVWAV
jgi:starch phosphorylase